VIDLKFQYLTDKSLHDGNLKGVESEDKNVTLKVTAPDGKNFDIALVECDYFILSEFQLGNIIYALEGCMISEENFEEVWRAMQNSNSEYIEKNLSKSATEKLFGKTYCELSSSYGARAWAICESIEVRSL